MSRPTGVPAMAPEPRASRTWYSSRTPAQALGILLALGSLIFWCLAETPRSMRSLQLYKLQAPAPDLVIYSNVVSRVHLGQSYYAALGQELRSQAFPTCSILNWRTPLHLSSIAHLPTLTWARILLILGSVAASAMAVAAVLKEGNTAMALAQGILMLSAFLVCFVPAGMYFAEVWAGMYIAISIGAYALNRWQIGVAAGVVALFYRELAAPYVAVSIFFAWRAQRKREVITWAAGLAAYLLYYFLHAHSVLSQLTSVERCSSMSWLQFGGIDSLIRMSRVGSLLAMPPWSIALYLPAALLGLAGWGSALGRRIGITVAVYLILFAAVGLPGNFYWGAIYAPLLVFGIVWSGPALRDLFHVLRANR